MSVQTKSFLGTVQKCIIFVTVEGANTVNTVLIVNSIPNKVFELSLTVVDSKHVLFKCIQHMCPDQIYLTRLCHCFSGQNSTQVKKK